MLTEKIKPLDELRDLTRALKAQGKAIVHCHGVFDLLHPGHIRHFEAAKREGDVLIVTMTKDEHVGKGPGRPVFNQRLRAESLAALQMVDYVAINQWPTAAETIRILQPDVYVKGAEYATAEDDLTGGIEEEARAIREVGGRIHFTSDITFSSSSLLNSYAHVLPEESEAFLRAFRSRYTAEDVIGVLRNLRPLRVLVFGDVIIDDYQFCEVLGKSSKAHAINARFLRSEAYAGGALAVANHVAGFCDQVHLVTCVGTKDSWEDFISQQLKPNVSKTLVRQPDAPTTVKRRFTDTVQYTQLFEVTFTNGGMLPPAVEQEVGAVLERALPAHDLVVAADFGHGLIGKKLARLLSKSGRYLAANVQSNSANMGYNLVTKYPRIDYMCLHEGELRLANQDHCGPLEPLIERTARRLRASTAAVTQGDQGSTTYQPAMGAVKTPVFSRKVVDSLGAGDAYLSVTAPCAAAGYSADLIGFVGNCVGALKLLILGNKASVEPVSLFKFVTTLLK